MRVRVLAELVEDKPVPQVAMTQDRLDGGHVGGGEPSDLEDDEEPSDGRNEDGEESEDQMEEGEDSETKQPEPEQQVHLERRGKSNIDYQYWTHQ